ncbi:MAG: ECF transporter S component [Oscillospiraceae bacterium]|nr:ECF transporter S component [Oscillospiraceae bacterium]
MQTKRTRPLIAICATALLAALAVVLYALGFPIFPAAPFLRLDFSDVPALVAALLFGPIYGVAVNLIQNLFGFLVLGSGAIHAGMGNLMNFVVGTAFIVPYAIIVRRARKKHGLLLASAMGMLSILIIGFGMNTIVMPLFFRFIVNMPPAEIWPMVWGAIWFSTALNAIKGVVLSVAGVAIMRIKKRLRLF